MVLGPGQDAEPFLCRLRETWEAARPHEVTFSAGVALVGTDPSAALLGADHALYRAKADGRDRWLWAPRTEDS
ncbi:MAG: hypothetical protein H0W25_06115 [Acidimicrobiia bacterium]|nr:hypothetical protein [Acidimicrobiia bacterium]